MNIGRNKSVVFAWGLFAIVIGFAPVRAFANPDLIESKCLLTICWMPVEEPSPPISLLLMTPARVTRGLRPRCSKRS